MKPPKGLLGYLWLFVYREFSSFYEGPPAPDALLLKDGNLVLGTAGSDHAYVTALGRFSSMGEAIQVHFKGTFRGK